MTQEQGEKIILSVGAICLSACCIALATSFCIIVVVSSLDWMGLL